MTLDQILEELLVEGIEAWKVNDAALIDAALEKAKALILAGEAK